MKQYPFFRSRWFFAFLFSFLGTLYSGTLSYEKLVSGVCAFSASCPYLFGLPVCVYGFFGFISVLTLLILSLFLSEEGQKNSWIGLFWFSLGGFLFALYFFVQELFFLPEELPSFHELSFRYPSCLYGWILFGCVFLLSRSVLKHWGRNNM